MSHFKNSFYPLNELRCISARISLPVTIGVVFYGDHPILCQRFLDRLYRYTDPKAFQLRAGLNTVCQETLDLVHAASEKYGNVLIEESDVNLYKCPMMRRLFYSTKVSTEWTVWFDDDSYVKGPHWLLDLALTIERHDETDLFGCLMRVNVDDPLEAFITQSPWYRGIERRLHPEEGDPIIQFPVGGFWVARTSRLYEVDWPDTRLTLYHEDFIMGEAMRQHGVDPVHFESGICISDAPHRAPADVPTQLPSNG